MTPGSVDFRPPVETYVSGKGEVDNKPTKTRCPEHEEGDRPEPRPGGSVVVVKPTFDDLVDDGPSRDEYRTRLCTVEDNPTPRGSLRSPEMVGRGKTKG